MRKVGIALVVLLVALAGQVCAGGMEIYINNKPFKGASSGPATDLMLEAGPYFQLAGGDFQFDADTGKATLDGAPLNVTVQGPKVFVRAKEMVSLVGGRYNANAALGTVDIYAFDPVEAARKAWARVFGLPAITNETDFQVMATLTRGVLTKELGLDLDFPVELVLSTREEIKALSGRDLDGYTMATFRDEGTKGLANAKIMVARGNPPIITMQLLAGGWGSLWTARQGFQSNEALIGGFSLWSGYYVLDRLGAKMDPGSWGVSRGEAARAEFRRLLDLQKTGGGPAVVNSIRNMAPGRSN